MATNTKLKAWVRYDGKNNIVPGSLMLRVNKPKVGTWEEIPVNLCCNFVSYNGWRVVTGGVAGDGTVAQYSTNGFNITGPDDDVDNGWVYIKKYFATETIFDVDYQWASVDEGLDTDRPIYCLDATEPTGVPSDTTAQVTTTPETGTWNITVPAGYWLSIGIYSSDSCCGRGFLSVDIIQL